MAGGGAGGGGFQIPNFDDFSGFKGGGGGGGYLPPGGTGGTPPGSTFFGGAGGAGSAYTGIGPMYDRGVPQFGYRRKPMGPVGNNRTSGAVSSPGGVSTSPWGGQLSGVDSSQFQSQAGPGASPMGSGAGTGPSWYGGGQAPGTSDWTIPQYIQNAQGAGAFDPLGSQGILNAIGGQYAQGYGSAQRGVRQGLQASGVTDPNAYAYGQLQGDLNAQGQYSNALDQARLQSMLQNQGFLQNVFQGNQGYAQNQALSGQQAKYNQMLYGGHSGLGGMIGSIGGAALGSFLGPIGTAAGGAVGRAIGGNQAQQAPQSSQWNPQFGPDPYAY